MQIILFVLLVLCVSSDDGIIIEEGAQVIATEDDISMDILKILTDISKEDQPTRINNSNGEKVYYILERDNLEYLVTIDSNILSETVLSDSFLQINY